LDPQEEQEHRPSYLCGFGKQERPEAAGVDPTITPGVPPDQLYRSLQIVTGDPGLNTILSNRNFKSSDTISGTADQTVEVRAVHN